METSQSTSVRCPICAENHYWRDCNHACILQCHHMLENLFRYRMADPAVYSEPLTHTLDQMPIPILRKLVQTQAPLALVGGDDHFRSLQQWRSRSAEQSKMVPSRIGIISAASNANILEMIRNIYNFWAERELSQIQEINSPVDQSMISFVERTYQENVRWNFSTELYRALGPVRRRLNPSSSSAHNQLTPQGLLTYIRQVESYLQQMGNNLETRLQSDAFHDYVPEMINLNSPWLVGVPNTSGSRGEVEWLRPQGRQSNRGDTAFDRVMEGEETTLPMHFDLLHITDNMRASNPDPEPPSDWNLPDFEPSTLTNYLDNALPENIQTRPRSALDWARLARQAAAIQVSSPDSSDSEEDFIPFGEDSNDTPEHVTQRRNRLRFPPFKLKLYDACQWNDSDFAPIADKHTLPPRPSDATPDDFSQEKCCGICWDDQTPSSSLYTHCGHSFCYDCITNMVKTMRNNQRRHHPHRSQTKMSCPMCRADVLSLTTFDSTCPIAKDKRNKLSNLLYHHPQGVQRPFPDVQMGTSPINHIPAFNPPDPSANYNPSFHMANWVRATPPTDYMDPPENNFPGIPTGPSTGITLDAPGLSRRRLQTSSDGNLNIDVYSNVPETPRSEANQFRTARDQLEMDNRLEEALNNYRRQHFTPSGSEHRTEPLDIRPRPSDASGLNFLNDLREAMQTPPDAPTTPSVIDTSGNRQEVPSTPRGGTPPEIIEDEDTRASETENSPLSNMLAEQWSRRPIFIANINEDTNPPPSFQSMAPLGLQPIESTENELARANQPDSSSDSDDSYSSMPPLEEIDQSSQDIHLIPHRPEDINLSIPIGSGVTDERLENFVRQLMARYNVTETGRPIPRGVLDRFRQSTLRERLDIVRALDAYVFGQTAEADLPLSTPGSSNSNSDSDSEAPTDVIVEQDNRAPRRNRYNNHDLL